MNSKKMVYWMAAIPAAIIILIILIVKIDQADSYVSRAVAAKAMALALTDKEGCAASQKEHASHFPGSEQENWYTKYVDYLLEKDLLETDKKVDKEFAENALTYGEAAYAAEKISPGLSQVIGVSKKKYKRPMPKEAWWLFYDSFLKRADQDGQVEKKNILLYGTPDNVKEASAWTAYTDLGIMGFEGIPLDSYIDREIQVIYRGSEMIHMSELVSEEVVYKNVWLSAGEKGKMNLYVGTIVRTFPKNEIIEEKKTGVLADLYLKRGKIQKISLKEETIEGKVLSVKEDSIEIEGYGNVAFDQDFKVYKAYGLVKELRKKDILVGYDLQKFVVADKKICAALLVKNFHAKDIRVLVMDSGYSSLFHENIRMKADTPLHLEYGEEQETIEAGTELFINKDDERLKKGRLTIEPEDNQKGIEVLSIERAQGTPSYYGKFEVSRESEGLLLLNELDMEDYLTRVVPSEMPASYELEALKAQAVCARTYAYRQIQANSYSQYGAHVDDSTNYQVYNNTSPSEKTDMAVKETYGEMVFYGEKPAETYYFSTSCGYTTDGTIWGADLESVPYLKGIFLNEDKKEQNLIKNEEFENFIKGEGERVYDSRFPMYRWTTKITNKQLEKTVDQIGTIQTLVVTERGVGGIAKRLKIIGSDGEKVLRDQNQIRNVLGNKDLVYKKNDGKTMTGWASLPSAFIAVDETARDEEKGIRTFTIWGGGYGHGVGMSQNGAQEMAKEGKNYKDILTFFYNEIEVKENES